MIFFWLCDDFFSIMWWFFFDYVMIFFSIMWWIFFPLGNRSLIIKRRTNWQHRKTFSLITKLNSILPKMFFCAALVLLFITIFHMVQSKLLLSFKLSSTLIIRKMKFTNFREKTPFRYHGNISFTWPKTSNCFSLPPRKRALEKILFPHLFHAFSTTRVAMVRSFLSLQKIFFAVCRLLELSTAAACALAILHLFIITLSYFCYTVFIDKSNKLIS